MSAVESGHQNGGKSSPAPPPILCDDSNQEEEEHQIKPGLQQQQSLPAPTRTTRYYSNSSLAGGKTRSNSTSSSIGGKKGLVRSHAVSEETSPPPPDGLASGVGIGANGMAASAPVVVASVNNNKNGRLKQQNSDQSSSVESSVSLDTVSANPKQSQDGDVFSFLKDTLNHSTKDRSLILRAENDLIEFIKNPNGTTFKFNPMSAYQRMLVHRVSAYFNLEHNVDNATSSIIVTKTKATRIPDIKLKDVAPQELSHESNKTVLRRENNGSKKAPEEQNHLNYSNSNKSRAKSYEERAEDYSRARRRIFNNDQQDPGSYGWSSSGDSTTNLPDAQGRPGKYMNRKSANHASSTLLKVESFETATISRKNKPPAVNKSYSFGGYGATDGTNNAVVGNSNNMGGFNRFNKQDSSSSSSGLSPASSGYKSQSFQSSTENTMTSPNSSASPQNLPLPDSGSSVLTIDTVQASIVPQAVTPHGMHHCIVAAPMQQPGPQQYIIYPTQTNAYGTTPTGLMQGAPLQMQPQAQMQQHPQQNPSLQENVVYWAVTDMNSVPNGSVLIDPRTGVAVKNPDGSTYYYDPTNPPKPAMPYPAQSAQGQADMMLYGQHQQQMPVSVEMMNPQGEMEHVTQWFTQMGIQQQQQPGSVPQVAANQQWGEEYYVQSPQLSSNSHLATLIATGGTPIVLDPSKISGTMGLNQQYYSMQTGPVPSAPSQPHYVMAAPTNATTPQPQQPVMMQYSVPTSAATSTPYMFYGVPYNSVTPAASAAANYNTLVHYGQPQPQPSPRPAHHGGMHQATAVPLRKEMCYVSPSPGSVSNTAAATSFLYNSYYNNVLAQVQNSSSGPRYLGNAPPYGAAHFYPRSSTTGYNSFRYGGGGGRKPRNKTPRHSNPHNDKPSNHHISSSSSVGGNLPSQSSSPGQPAAQPPPPPTSSQPPAGAQQQQSTDKNS